MQWGGGGVRGQNICFLICFVSQGVEQDAKNRMVDVPNLVVCSSYEFQQIDLWDF